MNQPINAVITAVGGYVPQERRTNFDLEKFSDTSDEWILKRTGIRERRILKSGEATSDMVVAAIEQMNRDFNTNLSEIQVVIVATSTPDMPMPSTASWVCRKLNLQVALAFDVNVACSGFVTALEMGTSLIESGRYQKVLVAGADAISRNVDITDRTTNILFGDGAGVVMLESSENEGVIDSLFETDNSGGEFLNIQGGGSLFPHSECGLENKNFIKQNGQAVFKKAIPSMVQISQKILQKNHLTIDDISFLIPHQANKRIIDAVGAGLDLPSEKVLINIENRGNTIAATIPLCLWENKDKIKKGDLLLFTAFGAGFSFGANLVRWQI